MYTLLIILGIIVFICFIAFSIYTSLPQNKHCYYCGKLISEVDNFYYVGPHNRHRCALHPSKNYRKVFFSNETHFNKITRTLNEDEVSKLRSVGTLDIVTYQDKTIKTIIRISQTNKTVSRMIFFNGESKNIDTKRSGIYKITRKNDGKIYIGQSKWIEKRWEDHRVSINFENKFSDGSTFRHTDFSFNVVINCPDELLDFLEAYFIAKYQSYERGLNKTRGNFSHLNDEQLKIINKMNNVTQEYSRSAY